MANWESLSASQRAAALHEGGPAACYAGPGSGKTRVVTLRAARLAERGAKVLVTTFTNDATDEMKVRIGQLLPKKPAGSAHVTTVHGLCLAILRRNGARFHILSDEGQRKGIAESALAYNLEGGMTGFLTRMSFLKNSGETVKSYRPDASHEDREFARVWKAYEKVKDERGLREFDDFLLDVCALFGDDAKRREWSEKYSHIIVDECQDMNRPQYQIVLALGRDHHNMMLVGDQDQSLYAFRGADSQTFKGFAAHPATKVYELGENYRSTRSIVSFADGLIKQVENRRAIPFMATRSVGAPVKWERYTDAEEEAVAIGDEILRLREDGANYADIAVLFRLNAQAEAFERNFAALGIPFVASKDGDFYARKEIAGLLAYLEFFSGYGDEWLLAFLNLPSRKLPRSVGTELQVAASFRGKSIWEILPDFHAPDLKSHRALRQMYRELEHIDGRIGTCAHAGDAVRLIRRATEFDNWLRVDELNDKDNDRIQNLERMAEAASHYPTVEAYLVAVRRVREEAARRKADKKKLREEVDAVTLATGHSAKGREWSHVFAAGWSEELLPHRKADDIDEERRIAYVMATRAKDSLMISSIDTWNSATVGPSRFLSGTGLAAIAGCLNNPT